MNNRSTNPGCEKYRHKDILNALDEIAKQKRNVNYRIVVLAVIKKYYDYLIDVGQRDFHPLE